MIRAIPKLNTLRLALGAMRPEDFDRFAEIWANREVVRHVGGTPWSRGRAWESFLRNAGHWQIAGFGQWAITELKSRQMIGQAGFFLGSSQLGEDFDAHPEAGWMIAPEAQRQGFGMEAARAAHDWHDRVIPGPLVARIAPDNEGSLKIAERLGYRLMRGAQAEGGGPVLLMIRRRA